ncbi:hypothetical protein ACHAQJ_008041 [Trichoderma viride]
MADTYNVPSKRCHGMTLRSATRPKTSRWMYLPTEIRLMVLETIVRQKHPGWASLASVCGEWKVVLEKANYRKLKLRSSRLNDFDSMVPPRKRKLIHHIWLDVELPRYTSRCCSRRRSLSPQVIRIVSEAIWKLFSILSKWTPANKLTLELNIISPSDSEHWFKYLYFSSDHIEGDKEAIQPYEADYPYHDPLHGWIQGQQVIAPPKAAVSRIFRPTALYFREALPRVEAVTRLVIRRQLRRCISPSGLRLLILKLGRLEDILYEPWISYDMPREFDREDISLIIRDHLPKTLNRLVVFEDSHEFYDAFPPGYTRMYSFFGIIRPKVRLDTSLASKSRDLQHFAVSFMVNAEEVFQKCLPTWNWPRLQSLSLTSQLLQNDWKILDMIESLLCRGGDLVQQMPKIQTFVLWNGGKSHACAFIYHVGRDRASITWRGTWNLQMSPRVVETWQRAASVFSSCELQVKQESIQEIIRCHGDAIYHLKLPCQVIDPASVWQIRREVGGLAQ